MNYELWIMHYELWIMIDGHGDDIYRYDDLVKMNFSSNIFQHTDHTALKQHLMERFDVVGNYPEPQARHLEKMIAQQEGISPECVLVTNGALSRFIERPGIIFERETMTIKIRN